MARVEAGLRSFNRRMPEEINRVVADHLSNSLLCPSDTAIKNLATEGITQNVHLVGDVMLDVLNWAKQRSDGNELVILERFGLKRQAYLVATGHRSENTDDAAKLSLILSALNSLDEPVIFPVHPRARKIITRMAFRPEAHLPLIDPLRYLDMFAMLDSAPLALTRSGGIQNEA